jgi:hypothetical protein
MTFFLSNFYDEHNIVRLRLCKFEQLNAVLTYFKYTMTATENHAKHFYLEKEL